MRGLLPLINYHLYHSFIVPKKKHRSTITGLSSVWWNVDQWFPVSFGRFGISIGAQGHPLLDWQEVLTRQSQYPTTLTQVILPFSSQCPMISPRLLCSCATLPSVSCMPMKLVSKYDHQKCRSIPPDVGFEPVKSPAKSASWNKPSLHSLAFVSNMTELSMTRSAFEITQSRQPFFTRSVPFCDSSS